MPVQGRPDEQKAIETLLYVTSRVSDMYAALKVVFFADQTHLGRYGRLIYGDNYVAMSHGPVPSLGYDMLKQDKDVGYLSVVPGRELFSHNQNLRIPSREPNLDLLSASDIECLDESIERYGRKSFAELKRLSHQNQAYQEADENDFMPLDEMVRALPNADEVLEYLEAE